MHVEGGKQIVVAVKLLQGGAVLYVKLGKLVGMTVKLLQRS